MGEFVEGVRRFAESEDQVYRVIRAERDEGLESFRKLHGMSRIEMGELCLDYLACGICEESISENDNFDHVVSEVKTRIMNSVLQL